MSFLNKKTGLYKILFLNCFILLGFFIYTNSFAASLYFSPAVGGFDVGNVFKVSVLVDTEDVAINSTETGINFPSDLLEVVSVSKTNSIFTFWVQDPTFSNVSGNISFSGGLTTPGFNGSSGKIIEIVFKVKRPGLASVLFSPGSVRANDGLGTDILKNVSQGSYTLTSGNQTPAVVSGTTPLAPSISSPTNPDPNKWYNNSNPRFVWPVSSNIIATRVLYDKYLNTSPIVFYSPAISEKVIDNLKDGAYYFHVQLENENGWGKISHFAFKIDTKNPDSFTITEIKRDDETTPKAKFTFSAKDSLSGIDHYEIQIDDGIADIWNDNGTHIYETPATGPGGHTLSAKAVDKAGNFITSSSPFNIEPLKTPSITDYNEKLSASETLTVSGQTEYPGSQVLIWLQKEGENPKSFVVQTDAKGGFTFTKSGLSSGSYKLWAEVKGVNGSGSFPSDKLTVDIESAPFAQFINWTSNVLITSIPLIALVIIIILSIIIISYAWHKFLGLKRVIQKETTDAEKNIHRGFDLLRDDLTNQIRKLNRTKSERDLTVIKDLRKSLDNAEVLIEKELKDIEKMQ